MKLCHLEFNFCNDPVNGFIVTSGMVFQQFQEFQMENILKILFSLTLDLLGVLIGPVIQGFSRRHSGLVCFITVAIGVASIVLGFKLHSAITHTSFHTEGSPAGTGMFVIYWGGTFLLCGVGLLCVISGLWSYFNGDSD